MMKETIQGETEHRSFAERALSTVFAGLLAVSACGTAPAMAYAVDEMGSSESVIAQTEETLAVAFAAENASVRFGDRTITDHRIVETTAGDDLIFTVDPQEGFAVTEVSLQRLSDGVLDVLEPTENAEGARYAVTADKLAEGTAIVVDTVAADASDEPSAATTCPTCKNPLVFDLFGDTTSLTVTGRTPSVNVKDVEKVYDGQPVSVEASAATAGATLSFYAEGMNGWSTEAPQFTDAGTYTVLVKATVSNESEAEVVTAHVTVKPAPVVIKVRDAEKTIGCADPAFEGAIEGLIPGDEIGSVVYYRLNNGVEDAGSYADVLSALVQHRNGNYAYTVVPGAFIIKNAAPAPAQSAVSEPNAPSDRTDAAGIAPVNSNLTTEFAQSEAMQRFAEDVVVPIAALLGVENVNPVTTIDDEATPLSAFEEEEGEQGSGWTYLWILLGAVILAAGSAVAALWRLRPAWFMELIYGEAHPYDPTFDDDDDTLPALDALYIR